VDAAADAELVARCRTGEQAAWEALVDRYARYVYAIATRVYRLGPEDADDVFQEVFTRFERLDTLRDGEALRPGSPRRRGTAPSTRCVARREVAVEELPDESDEASPGSTRR
jgi:hypothetical protein